MLTLPHSNLFPEGTSVAQNIPDLEHAGYQQVEESHDSL